MRLVGQRILHCLPGKLYPISKDCVRAGRTMAAAAICSPDLEYQLPLLVQRFVRRPERIALIINVCSFGGCAIELDGAASEATNIYDEGNSLWSAYKTLYQQWKLVFQIGAANRSRGHRPASPNAVFRDWIEFSRQAMEYPLAD